MALVRKAKALFSQAKTNLMLRPNASAALYGVACVARLVFYQNRCDFL